MRDEYKNSQHPITHATESADQKAGGTQVVGGIQDPLYNSRARSTTRLHSLAASLRSANAGDMTSSRTSVSDMARPPETQINRNRRSYACQANHAMGHTLLCLSCVPWACILISHFNTYMPAARTASGTPVSLAKQWPKRETLCCKCNINTDLPV